jgi:acetyltransferase-like isoleucine patch superfamily enzyme
MVLRYIDKVLKGTLFQIGIRFSWIITYSKLKMNGVIFNNDFISKGIPIINVSLSGSFSIGKNFIVHSGKYYNMIGRQQRCFFIVGKKAKLLIGDNVGISGTALICHKEIIIEDNVRIGGGVVIYDTDFHSLDLGERIAIPEITENIRISPVKIKQGAFIGAHSIILKGVVIGNNSILGAGSVLSKSIPDNQLWAGNPAKFIREI